MKKQTKKRSYKQRPRTKINKILRKLKLNTFKNNAEMEAHFDRYTTNESEMLSELKIKEKIYNDIISNNRKIQGKIQYLEYNVKILPDTKKDAIANEIADIYKTNQNNIRKITEETNKKSKSGIFSDEPEYNYPPSKLGYNKILIDQIKHNSKLDVVKEKIDAEDGQIIDAIYTNSKRDAFMQKAFTALIDLRNRATGDIDTFRLGDIIISSLTRGEFWSLLRSVTSRGGITKSWSGEIGSDKRIEEFIKALINSPLSFQTILRNDILEKYEIV